MFSILYYVIFGIALGLGLPALGIHIDNPLFWMILVPASIANSFFYHGVIKPRLNHG
jgi:hypothetical protein